jgi:hypothetical protein
MVLENVEGRAETTIDQTGGKLKIRLLKLPDRTLYAIIDSFLKKR